MNPDDAFWSKEPRHLCYNRLPLLADSVYDVNYTGSGVSPQHTYPYRDPPRAGDVVFVKTDLLDWYLENRTISVPIVLVTGVSDISPSPFACQRVLETPLITNWIGCNIPVSHPKIIKMPIGVGEPERVNGNHATLQRLHHDRVPWDEKQSDVCVPWYTKENHPTRTVPPTLPKFEFEDYMREISKHKFVVCPRGNGLDTHRVCEVLLMGSVPVLQHSGLDDMYSQWPCLLVDSLDAIDTSSFTWDSAKYESFLDVFWLRNAHGHPLVNTGQIQLTQPFGQWISKYAADQRFTRYTEIGTWNGRGSTCCFYDGFRRRESPATLQSYEISDVRATEAMRLWASVPAIQVIRGRMLADEECPSVSTVEAVHPTLTTEWHTEDMKNFWACPYVPMNDPEVVLLDGAEYLTYFEFEKMKTMSGIRVVLLDDVSIDKCRAISASLLQHPDWTRIAYSETERNGWAVFERTVGYTPNST